MPASRSRLRDKQSIPGGSNASHGFMRDFAWFAKSGTDGCPGGPDPCLEKYPYPEETPYSLQTSLFFGISYQNRPKRPHPIGENRNDKPAVISVRFLQLEPIPIGKLIKPSKSIESSNPR
jgi:hypothetical protein